ncbi:MAG TPA: SusD/RagB family nutrient-binding outer membrane lipoprotein, partial [Chitinophagaceae bacterium]|nr:SusD/RagB family nutrient-binding outer membrane lipoprotein [Chitinophagaceae bacterium]
MQALIFQKLVDFCGNVPYSQALQGTAFITPVYDNAQTIYEDLIRKLDEAIADIKANPFPISEPADITFASHGGPTGGTKWIQFANTVKMRILMRQSFMSGRSAYITAEINKIVAENSGLITYNILSNPGYTKSPGKLNQFYGTYGYTENDVETGTFRFRKMNAVIINWLKNSNDIFRLRRLATPKVGGDPSNPGDYLGVPLGPCGALNIYLETLVSSVGSEQVVKGDATRPMIIMTAAEAYFLKAEAAQRYGISAWGGGQVSNAQQSYEAGVRWAFRLAAATHTSTATATDAQADAAANSYLASGTVNADWAASPDKIKAILVQKWTALTNIDGSEAWAEYRKSNTPTDPGAAPYSVKSCVSGSTPEPVRLYYPLREENVNQANVQQPNVFTQRIFWDVQ